jgi:hypothetical protein
VLGRVRLPRRSPTSPLLCRPPTPCPLQPRLRFPSSVAYLDAGACSVPHRADDPCARYVPCVGDHAPALRKTGMGRGEARASQVTGPSSACVPWSNTPPDTTPYSPSSCRESLLPSMKSSTLGIREGYRFRGRNPTARTFVCLRIACRVSTTGARLATGSGGLTLGRAGFAPAGRQTKFHGDIASSNAL